MTRIVIVEDELLFRLGMKELLSLRSAFQVVGEAANGAEARQVVESAKPDLILLDMRLPGTSGVELVRHWREVGVTVPILLLSTFDDDDSFFEGLRYGANGFLRKDVSMSELESAIATVLRGERYLKPAVTETARRHLEQKAAHFESSALPDPLSPREVEVLRLMAGGLSNREIADAFGTSETTVKSQVSSIISKLGVRDRIRAVLFALEKGYI
ncbi:MAG: response regulator transcription factor [Bryobacteraceae bacterium]